jgi:hypothetical protein
MLVESDSMIAGGLQSVMNQLSTFAMAAEDAAVAVDYSSSQASEFSNYSLYGTLALVSYKTNCINNLARLLST